jgi:hypothetical protein
MNRHVGDLGNVTSDSAGNINIDIEDWIIQLYNRTQSIANRTIVLHAKRDDGGMGGFSDSSTTGYVLLCFVYRRYFVFFVEMRVLELLVVTSC